MEPQIIQKVLQTVSELLEKLGIDATLSEKLQSDDDRELLVINIKVKSPSLLIGQQGANLEALQHIARLLFRRKTTEHVNFIIDINEYKTQRIEYLKSLAVDISKRVLETGKFEVMRPMSSYERRIVHMELVNIAGVSAESLGEEPNRRIVVTSTKEEKTIDEIKKEIDTVGEESTGEVAHIE